MAGLDYRVWEGLGRVGQGRAGSDLVGLGRARPDRAGQCRAGSGLAGLGRARPDRVGQGRAGPNRAGPNATKDSLLCALKRVNCTTNGNSISACCFYGLQIC